MKHFLPFTFILLLFASTVFGQHNFIGLDKKDIEKKMENDYPNFYQAKVINRSYNYLKYQDDLGEQTILFFLNDDDECFSMKMMSHYVYLGEEITKLNKNYTKEGDDKWTFEDGGDNYTVKLKQEQWFFSIIVKKEKKE